MGVEATKVAMFCGCLRYKNVDVTMISPGYSYQKNEDIILVSDRLGVRLDLDQILIRIRVDGLDWIDNKETSGCLFKNSWGIERRIVS